MFRVTSLTSMDERQLNKWIKRVALLLVAGTVLFAGFYFLDRWRAPATPIVDQRLSALEQAVRDNPKDIVSRGQLADTYVAKGRYEDAITQYNAILDTGQEEELATFGRAAAYLGLEQYDLATTDYLRVVEIAKDGEMANVDPMLQAAYYNLGDIAMKQAKPAEAIPYLEKALAIKRSDADSFYLIGQAYTQAGQTDKAETALRAAVAFVPIGWPEPYLALVDTFTKAGRTAMAEWAAAMADVASDRADEAEPRLLAIVDDPDAALDAAVGLGLVNEMQGDLVAAAEWYSKALEVSPGNSAARLGLNRVGSGATALPALPTPAAPGGEND